MPSPTARAVRRCCLLLAIEPQLAWYADNILMCLHEWRQKTPRHGREARFICGFRCEHRDCRFSLLKRVRKCFYFANARNDRNAVRLQSLADLLGIAEHAIGNLAQCASSSTKDKAAKRSYRHYQ